MKHLWRPFKRNSSFKWVGLVTAANCMAVVLVSLWRTSLYQFTLYSCVYTLNLWTTLFIYIRGKSFFLSYLAFKFISRLETIVQKDGIHRNLLLYFLNIQDITACTLISHLLSVCSLYREWLYIWAHFLCTFLEILTFCWPCTSVHLSR